MACPLFLASPQVKRAAQQLLDRWVRKTIDRLKSHSCPGVTPLRRENLGSSPAVTSDREPGCAGRCRVLGGAFLTGCA